jgi:hypothetical protein
MVIEGITDKHLAEIYADPYIQKVGHDHRPAAPINHPLVTYLTASVNGKFAGAFIAIQASPIDLEFHSLLKKNFVLHSRNLAKEFLDWAFSKPIERVTALIIEGLETAKNFGLKLGFKLEGIKRNACLVNGELKNVYILGLTRQDWGLS